MSPSTEHPLPTVRFGHASRLRPELVARVDAALRAADVPRHGGMRIAVKTAAILSVAAASYVHLLRGADGAFEILLTAFVLAQAIVMIGFCVMHDGSHGSFAASVRVNRCAAYALDVIGGSQFLWRVKHGTIHHTYTNLDGHDDDLESNGLLRMHPTQPRRTIHRYQAIYAFPLYGLLALHWTISDFREFFGARVGRHAIARPTARDVAAFLAFKGLFVSLAIGLPVALHGPRALLVFLFVEVVVGASLAVVFQLAHVVEETEMPELDATGRVDDEWFVHQLATTANFATRNSLVTFYTGGLNHQIEHHLFPRISHVRYPIVAPVVAAFCQEHGLPYHENRTVLAAIASHRRRLRSLGEA